MVWFISDPHWGENVRGLEKFLEARKEGDLLIILGDVGLKAKQTPEVEEYTKWFMSLDADIAFLDGNHENFDYLESFPLESWNGGQVRRVTERIVWLQRGNVYEIGGKRFFVMGGCKSSAKWKGMGLWWPQEAHTPEQLQLGFDNLKKLDNKVDYILTHKYCGADVEVKEALSFEGLNRYIDTQVQFAHWYSGHWHRTEFRDEKHTVVYDEPVGLEL